MLQHRLSKFGSTALVALCLLFTGSIMQSCNDELFDDYKYDDEYPNWLGGSIYDALKGNHGGHTYQTYLYIIDSLNYRDVLERTGSKTLFVADDAAFEEFFANGKNRWQVSSKEELSKNQMRVLLFSSMLDNAYLLDMMSSLPGAPPVEGSCLRRETSLPAEGNLQYCSPEDLKKIPAINKHWARFRAEDRNGLILAMGDGDPMMVHFLREYRKSKAITNEDINVIFNTVGQSRSGDEAFIYQTEVLKSGIEYGEQSDDSLTITCKNGYVYRVSKVLLPPSNMAEELRNKETTQIFSHLLDRFSFPVYSESLETKYAEQIQRDSVAIDGVPEGVSDSVYVFRYFNKSSVNPAHALNNGTITVNTDNPGSDLLAFDPAWNEYTLSAGGAQGDMAAIFAPNDVVMAKYFLHGEAKFLTELYAEKDVYESLLTSIPEDAASISDTDYDLLYRALDSIPNNIIASFLNNLMQSSFVNTVPSKFHQVYNDGSQLMFKELEDAGLAANSSDYSKVVDECIVANNGVIYIMNYVFGPAEYRSVSAPPLAMTNMTIIKQAIDHLGYNSYLLAMDATYSFIVPDNNYFIYYDPVRRRSATPLAYQFFYNNKYSNNPRNANKLWAKVFAYNPETYEVIPDSIAPYAVEGTTVKVPRGDGSGKQSNLSNGWSDGNLFYNRLTDLLEYLIIIGDVTDGNKYHQSKGYGTIKCNIDDKGEITFYGGEQIENGLPVKVLEAYPEKNGVTYCTVSASGDTLTSGIPTPPTHSVSYKLNPATSVNDNFDKFYELCYGSDNMPLNVLEAPSDSGEMAGGFFNNLYPGLKTAELTDTAQRYSIFYGSTSKTRGNNVPLYEAVPFFSTYHYTVYAPTNEALDLAYNTMGLPTWDELIDELLYREDTINRSEKIASYVRLINKFARYHFQDNAVFVDNNVAVGNYETAAIDDATGRFFETVVSSPENGQMVVTDDMGNNINVLSSVADEEGKTWNVMTRDLLLKCTNSNDPRLGERIETSSFAVIHQVDRVLLNDGVLGYDGKFRRYADNGEYITLMTVDGVPAGSGFAPEKYGEGKYLVAHLADELVGDELHSYAYLMQPIEEGATDKLNMEAYVYDAGNNRILINEEGWRVYQKIHRDTKGKILKIEYLWADENGNHVAGIGEDNKELHFTEPQVRYYNNGNIIK